jgi:hypothetical protein
VFTYFNNDTSAYAVRNAATLRKLVDPDSHAAGVRERETPEVLQVR